MVHCELELGVDSLATVASVAPLLGLLLACLGIVESFRGFVGDKATFMAVTFDGLSEAVFYAALGLFIGIMSLWFCRYLRSELRQLEVEMSNVTLELVNTLTFLARRQETNGSLGT